jgi:pimeloyl-ACP methyl ester carboxylesterase
MSTRSVYFIPGRAEAFGDTLGRSITELGCALDGRRIDACFARAAFADQLGVIRSDVATRWHDESVLIGRSYGAYLLLHVLADLPPFPGRILLCSPILGPAVAADGKYGSRPPRAARLLALAAHGGFPPPRHLEIHTGANDNGCDPRLAARFTSSVAGATLDVVGSAGHALPEEYLKRVLRRFLR